MRANVKATSFAVNGSPLWNDGVVDEVEEPGLVVLLLPRLREAGDELARLVHVDELVEDVLVDLERRVELGVAGVHVHGLVDGGDAKHAAALGLPLRARGADAEAAEEAADPRGRPPARRPIEPLHAL